jgi:putative oxidoreductase
MMRRFMANDRIELAMRWFLGLIFLYSSLPKALHPEGFERILHGYLILPAAAIPFIAVFLPFVEMAAGLTLLLGIFPRSAALIVELLLWVFMVAIAVNLFGGVAFDCGCFSVAGSGPSSSAGWLLFRDVLCVAAGIPVLFFKEKRRWCLRQTGGLLS